ncbi:MAG TPA: RIP metalloprotease RseP [Terracidiphilus sp.]|nr:RIP metalloprotease RseP [Terracidiphilus sp.]
MHDVLVSIVAFIILIGVMVVVHEFGHFLVAKLCRVRVERFSIGFPPRLFGIKIGETDYCVSATPLGGYVKMTGENMPGENMSVEAADRDKIQAQQADPGALTSHPRWQRILIAVAGPAANMLLALVVMIWYFGWVNEVPSVRVHTTTVDWIVPGSVAANAGLQPGDVVTSYGGINDPTWNKVRVQSSLSVNQQVPLTVDRGGKVLNLSIQVPASAKSQDFDLPDMGIWPQTEPGPIQVTEVQPDTPAARSGMKVGDAIESVDGVHLHSLESFVAYLQADNGKPVNLVLLRSGKSLPPITVSPTHSQGRWMVGFAGVLPAMRNDPLPFGQAVSKAADFCGSNSFFIVEVLERLFSHKVSVSQLSGPIGIAYMAGQAAQTKGWLFKAEFASEISLNLGILNLLPFPILDGGMILFLLIESVLRHEINLNVKEKIYQAAFVMLVAFFVFIIFNDMSKLPVFMHGKP